MTANGPHESAHAVPGAVQPIPSCAATMIYAALWPIGARQFT
jgi:hypothetical protein